MLLLCDRSGPDLIFGASTGFYGWNGLGGKEKRSRRNFRAFGDLTGDGFQIGFDEAHGADKDGAVGVGENQRGDHGEAVSVGDDVAFVFEVEQDGKCDAVFLIEGGGFLWAVLRDADNRDIGTLVALIEALEEGKCKLADGAADFEEREKNGAFFEGGGKGKVFAVERFEGEVGREIAGDDVGHAWFGSEGA